MKTTLRSALYPGATRRIGFAMGFFLVLSGLLTPLMPVVEAAADAANQSSLELNARQPLVPLDPDESDDTDGDTPDPGQGDPQPPPPEEDVTEPPADGDAQPENQLQQEQPAALQVNLHWCDSSADLANAADGEPLKSTCTLQGAPVQVSLVSATSSNPDQQGSVSTFPGTVQFTQLPQDSWTIFFQTPDNTPDALFCFGNTTHGNTKPYARYFLAQTVAPGYPIDTLSDESIICDWFGELPDPDQLTLVKYNCPAGFDLAAATHTSAMQDCTGDVDPPVQFTVTNNQAGMFEVSVTTDPIANTASIPEVPAGETTITETLPQGYDLAGVFCMAVNGTNPPTTVNVENGNSWKYTSDPNAPVICDVFNVPGDMDTTDATGTSLTIYKWECPPDTMYEQMDDYYSAECATEQSGVPFQITDDSGSQDTTSDTNGRQIDGLIGEITIQEMIPAGFGDPMVFCQLLNDPASMRRTSTNGRITLEANSTDDYQCFWYNIPYDGTSVTIYKWECPAGTALNQADPNYYSAECAMEQPGVPFQITDDSGTQDTTSDTNGRQIDGLIGQITIQEMIPAGFGDPMVFCQMLNQNASTQVQSTNGLVTLGQIFDDDYQCFWYNIPDVPSTVTISKWRCPDGMPAEQLQQWFQSNCTTPQDGIEYSLTDSTGTTPMTTAGGMVQWTDVSTGAVQISETIPPGFDPHPFVVCVITEPNGQPTTVTPATVNGTWHTTIAMPGTEIHCDWYNWYLGPGEITVHKWTCPEGYDRHAWGADPLVDCTTATNGITFKLDQPDPEVDLFSDTGDSIDGAVYFGGLVPGDYTLSEMIGPGEYMEVFVWQCYGMNTSSVHSTPLSVGQNLSFTIVGGDSIVCHWFNVPYPQYGSMVVTKFNCSTEKYVSDVYCYTNQTGQYFDLQRWNGSTWTTVQSGTTDVSGKVSFNNLDDGDYRLTEPNMQACLMKSSNITPGGNIGVVTGESTTVHVYNCKTPPPPQKTPTKYPNTGVGSAVEGGISWTPGIELAGLLGLLGMRLNRRRALAGVSLVAASGAASSWPRLTAQELIPLDSTPAPGTPDPAALGCATPTIITPETIGTPHASSTPVIDPCNRGAIPMQMRIPVINVDAPMEYLEIIDGAMQQPTGATHVAWYKETSRLGEVGNGIYAAHLNWWGVPEGVFFRLESLKEGDIVEVDGDDLQTYLFEVQWMQNFPSDEEPPDEALGMTNEVAITLITCGGEWITDRAEYNHRTLVRAVLRQE